MQKFTVPANVLQAVAEYLSTRPFKEVAGLIQALSQAEPVAEAAAEPDVD